MFPDDTLIAENYALTLIDKAREAIDGPGIRLQAQICFAYRVAP